MEENLSHRGSESMDFWRPREPGEPIHELVDVVEEPPGTEFTAAGIESPPPATQPDTAGGIPENDLRALTDETRRVIAETVERVVRDMIPAIAERVIRQEIEKLKSEME